MTWRPMSEAPETPATYLNVRSIQVYRWLAYKRAGAQIMGKPGRWQRKTEHGWENCPKPGGEWLLFPEGGP